MSPRWTVRPAVHEDALAIAAVHVDTWRATYRGLLPDAFLDALSVDARAAMWSSAIGAGRDVSVAEVDEVGVVGFAACGPARLGAPEGFDAELYAIYVLPRFHGLGLGRALVASAARHLAGRRMMLWVLDGNPASAFYEALGGRRLDAIKPDTIGGQAVRELAYGWDDMVALAGVSP